MILEKMSMILQRLKKNAVKNSTERPVLFAVGIVSMLYGLAWLAYLLVSKIL